jgi:hypothetical protein
MDLLFTTILEFWYIMLVVFILGRFIYYPNQGKREFLFTYQLLAAIISILCILISRVEFGIGFALGIFAVFSIVRYRTEPISPREMTYIFLAAGIAAKNSLVLDEILFYRMILADVFILVTAWVAEYFLFRKQPTTKLLIYDNLELIHPDKRLELTNDLDQRFGISGVEKIQVGRVDAVKNSARLLIAYQDPDNNNFDDK